MVVIGHSSPTPIHSTGILSTDFKPITTPPLAVPSNLVNTNPEIGADFVNHSAFG